MSSRAGPVRSSRRHVRQQPYARPGRSGNASAALARRPEPAQPAQPSLFTRIKQFFWGSPAPKPESPRMSEPPVLLGEDKFEIESEAEHEHELEQHELEQQSTPEQEVFEDSRFADIDSDTTTGSRIVHTSRSFNAGLEATPAVVDGPNEALRHFFDTKGDEELSNMEVVGVLSLIGQAVSRNESLVDFSQLSMDQRSDADATANDTSVLRGLHAPPSPRLYLQGTPPPSGTRKAVDRSPWSSTPRRSSIRSRYSLATAPPRRESLGPAPRATRPSGLRNSLSRKDTSFGGLSARADPHQQPRVTPAASAILQALDNESPPKSRVLAGQRPSRISEHETTAPRLDATTLSQASTMQPASSTPKPTERVPSSLLSHNGEVRITEPTPGLARDAKFAEPAASSVDASASQYSGYRSEDEASSNEGGEIEGQAFAFDIPESTAPRELTPAEEAIVAETQSEFTF